MKILFIPDACYGCRLCELACSFHHQQVFSPEKSSIKVSRDNENGNVTASFDSTCDLCTGETAPVCVKYCVYQALKIERRGKREH